MTSCPSSSASTGPATAIPATTPKKTSDPHKRVRESAEKVQAALFRTPDIWTRVLTRMMHNLTVEQRQALVRALERDVTWLEGQGVFHYSLQIGVCPSGTHRHKAARCYDADDGERKLDGVHLRVLQFLNQGLVLVMNLTQVQHLVAQFVLKEVIESAVDRCEPGDEVLFGVGYGRIIRAPSIQVTCEGQIKP